LSWFEITAAARSDDGRVSSAGVALDQLGDAIEVAAPLALRPPEYQRLDPSDLAVDRRGRRNAAAGERRDRLGQLALRLGCDR
jgi:hypothetical protein